MDNGALLINIHIYKSRQQNISVHAKIIKSIFAGFSFFSQLLISKDCDFDH